MSVKQYLATMAFATLLGWGVWVLVLFYIDPTVADMVGFIFFYASLFLSLLGTYSVIALALKVIFIKNDVIIFRHTKKTFKQAFIFSTYLIISLFLLQKNLLNCWNFFILTSLYMFIEGTILTSRKQNTQNYV